MSVITRAPETGCDFVLHTEDKPIRILQLTDLQIIDAAQSRVPDRLRPDEINAWPSDGFDALCGNQIRSLVAQTRPDLIVITGDIIYGSFDDAGTTTEWFCRFMDSLEIPWAPVFGNHDNETQKGVAWQCEQYEHSRYCLFRRGTVTGNSNYTVGIAANGKLLRVLHLLDSNGCRNENEPSVVRRSGLYPDQLALVRENTRRIGEAYGKVKAFCAFHIPTAEFLQAEIAAGYAEEKQSEYVIGVDVPAKNGDFGFKLERTSLCKEESEGFLQLCKECRVDGVFVGHCHRISTVISHEGIRWVYGLKTGQYDYHLPGQMGGTLITLEGEDFQVSHVPCLTPFAPFPALAPMFEHFFSETEKKD